MAWNLLAEHYCAVDELRNLACVDFELHFHIDDGHGQLPPSEMDHRDYAGAWSLLVENEEADEFVEPRSFALVCSECVLRQGSWHSHIVTAGGAPQTLDMGVFDQMEVVDALLQPPC